MMLALIFDLHDGRYRTLLLSEQDGHQRALDECLTHNGAVDFAISRGAKIIWSPTIAAEEDAGD